MLCYQRGGRGREIESWERGSEARSIGASKV